MSNLQTRIYPSPKLLLHAGMRISALLFLLLLIHAPRSTAQQWTIKHTNNASYYNALHFPTTSVGYAFGATLAKTTNTGDTWTDINFPFPVSDGILTDGYFTSQDTGCVVGYNFPLTYILPADGFIMRTTDGGQTWTTVLAPIPDFPFFGIHFSGRDTGYACGGQYAEGKIFRTIDGGLSWTQIYNGQAGTMESIYDIFAISGAKAIGVGEEIAPGTQNRQWTVQNAANTTTGNINNSTAFRMVNVRFPDNSHGYAIGFANLNDYRLVKSTDGGATWGASTAIPAFSALYYCGLAFPAVDTGFIAGDQFFTTNDGGATWTPQAAPAGAANMQGNFFLSTTLGFACGDGQILKYAKPTDPAGPLSATLSPLNADICAGTSLNLHTEVQDGTGTIHYQWSPAQGLSCTDCADPIASPSTTTTYTLTVSDDVTAIPLTATVTVKPAPVITITNGSSITLNAGQSVTLTANGGTEYSWSPGTYLGQLVGNTVVATPQQDIVYTVTAAGENGCPGSASISIQVIEGALFIPNAFSPNGDGLNDRFAILGLPAGAHAQTRIFNRWGQLVYESTAANSTWDGTFKGNPAPSDVYNYHIEVYKANGTPITFRGDVSLLR